MWDKRPKTVSLPQYLQSWHQLRTLKNTRWWPLPFCVKCTLGKEHQTDWKQTQEHSSNPLHNPLPLSSLRGDHYCTCKRIKVSLKGGQFVYIRIVFWQANGQIERQTNGKTKKKKNRDIAFGIPHILHTLDECVEQECWGGAGHLALVRSLVRIPSSPSSRLKCHWARYWTPKCMAASASSVWMCVWQVAGP